MKIAICASFVPFIRGGDRNIVDWLRLVLLEHGHDVEKIYLPHVDQPDLIFEQMAAYRWIDLSDSTDRIICFRPPAHYIPHPNKILWFIHHMRAFYDWWDHPHYSLPASQKDPYFREALVTSDTKMMKESKKIYTNSKVVSNRLLHFNQIESEVLYPPIYQPERFHFAGQNDEIFCMARLENHKRQHLLIEAMAHTKTAVKLRIAGKSSNPHYPNILKNLIKDLNLQNKVFFDNTYITEEEKTRLYSTCLAAAYIPADEDSYGYASLEACHSSKPIITTSDSGGVLELVEDGVNGYICEPSPKALADAMDQLYSSKKLALTLGQTAKESIKKLNIHWDNVIEKLLV